MGWIVQCGDRYMQYPSRMCFVTKERKQSVESNKPPVPLALRGWNAPRYHAQEMVGSRMSYTTTLPISRGYSFCRQNEPCLLSFDLDLKTPTDCQAQLQVQFIVFDLKVVHRSGAYYPAVNVVPRFPRASSRKGEGIEADIDDYICTYCILEQVPGVENIPQEKRPASLDASTSAELREAQQKDAFSQYASEHFETDLCSMVDDQELFAEKHSPTGR